MAVDKIQQSPEPIESGWAMEFLKQNTSIVATAAAAILAFQVSTAQAEEQKTVQVADASGKMELANYTWKEALTSSDQEKISLGLQELTKWFITDGESEEDAREYAQGTMSNILNGSDGGAVEEILTFAPKFAEFISDNPGKFDSRVYTPINTAVIRKKTEALDELASTLSGNN